MSSYKVQTNREYGSARGYFKANAKKIGDKFTEYRWNAMKRCIEHADPTHINDVFAAALGLGRKRETDRIIKAMALPFPWDETEKQFKAHEKMTDNQKKRLSKLQEGWEELYEKAEAIENGQEKVSKPFDDEVLEQRLKALKKKAEDNGLDINEALAKVFNMEEAA